MRLRSYFEFEENQTNIKTEVIAGVTTFFALAYIIVVNPAILSEAISIQGFSDVETFQMIAIVTIVTSAIAMFVMGLYANRPFALAPGLGLNAFFAFSVVLGFGIPWQTALAAVFVEGLIFILLTITGARSYIITIFPEPVKLAIGSGIGAFLLMIGLQELQVIVNDEATLVSLGDIATNPVALLGLATTALILVLWSLDTTGAIIIGIATGAIAGYGLTLAGVVAPGVLVSESVLSGGFTGLVGATQLNITPLAGAFIEGFSGIQPLQFVLVVLTFFFVDFFDTAGALIGLGQYGGFLDKDGELPEMEKPLLADGIGTTVGGMLGTSTITTFIESSAGIEEGGSTGMTAITVAVLFLLTIPLVSLVSAIPSYASYSALIVVGISMFEGAKDISWSDPTWAVPAALTITIMPLTYSIADGIAAGIIVFPIVKSLIDGSETVTVSQWSMAATLVVYYLLQTSGLILG